MSTADGLEAWQMLKDLRFIKLPPDVRVQLKELIAKDKVQTLDLGEETWLRQQYNRRTKAIAQLHKAQEAVLTTDARIRRGEPETQRLKSRAVRVARRIRKGQIARLTLEIAEMEEAEKDFGI